jgi:uncharacterized protein Usg
MILLRKSVFVTVDVLYYMPDFEHIVQEFIWQTEDLIPEMTRVKKYLNHWSEEIEAVVKQVKVGYASDRGWQRVEFEGILR